MSDRSDYNPSTRPPGTESRADSQAPAVRGAADVSTSPIDLRERGATRDGVAHVTERRLFFQLLVFRDSGDEGTSVSARLTAALQAAHIECVVYDDLNDPWSAGVLTFSEDPAHFVTVVRPCLTGIPHLSLRADMTMLGRSYASGHEQDLLFWLIDKPRSTVLEEKWPWAVWYPLRRNGAFARLEAPEQGRILKEHAIIGRAYAAQDLAHDVRLACHGMDTNDNEFVIGLIGKDLHPLSHIVQEMRKTRQTSEYIAKMGPFFVGRVASRVTRR